MVCHAIDRLKKGKNPNHYGLVSEHLLHAQDRLGPLVYSGNIAFLQIPDSRSALHPLICC